MKGIDRRIFEWDGRRLPRSLACTKVETLRERRRVFFLLQLFNLSTRHSIFLYLHRMNEDERRKRLLMDGDSFLRLSVEELENRRAIAADADWKEEAFTLLFYSMLIINDGWFLSLSLFLLLLFFLLYLAVRFFSSSTTLKPSAPSHPSSSSRKGQIWKKSWFDCCLLVCRSGGREA